MSIIFFSIYAYFYEKKTYSLKNDYSRNNSGEYPAIQRNPVQVELKNISIHTGVMKYGINIGRFF